MKITKLTFLSALVLLGLASCEKDDSYSSNEDKRTVADLVIPGDFDWATTKDAKCTVISDHSALLSIYLDAECSENNLLATLPVGAGTNMSIPLSIPKEAKKVYVQYTNASGKKVVDTPVDANGNITFNAPADSKRLASKAEGDFEPVGPDLYYPKMGGGVILFEDGYPQIGDYDFNDFVARYEAKVTTKTVQNIANVTDIYVDEVKFIMYVEATGGKYRYIPSLRLPFSISAVASVEAVADGSKDAQQNMVLEKTKDNSTKKNVVFIMNGAEKNGSMNSGSPYLNTENGFSTTSTQRVTLTVKFLPETALLSDLTANLFDIFLINKDKTSEIHLLGYGSAFGDQNESYQYGKDQTTYKQEGTNLVWAINIPEQKMSYPYEKANFLNAYTSFAKWAESGGKTETDWYANKSKINKDYLFKK